MTLHVKNITGGSVVAKLEGDKGFASFGDGNELRFSRDNACYIIADDEDGYLRFLTGGDISTLANIRMEITPTGNVGIGTLAPALPLEVSSSEPLTAI